MRSTTTQYQEAEIVLFQTLKQLKTSLEAQIILVTKVSPVKENLILYLRCEKLQRWHISDSSTLC